MIHSASSHTALACQVQAACIILWSSHVRPDHCFPRYDESGNLDAGSFGRLDPASAALQDYLQRIQQQAQEVCLPPLHEDLRRPSWASLHAVG